MSRNGTKQAVPPNETGETEVIQATIKLRRLARVVYEIPITGTAPLIVNQWSAKAKEQMREGQGGRKIRGRKEPKDPLACFEASRYRLPDGRDGFPARSFKAAIVHASRLYDGVTIVSLKQTVTVIGEGDGSDQLVPLTYGSITMREDTPRNSGGEVDLRYRAQFWPWSAMLRVLVIEGMFDVESVFSLVDSAGIGGIGEWRPSSPKSATGTFGTFKVAE